ncbi:MAG: ABC transporter ATP-binding protein [Arcanobacterium sp.]|nr:ABC transporter ATP-binding protein [Arcanobacterium sp.]MDY5588574.1 ABC transporter ATP-binding protein [Arcanobacterium sp.]
MQAPAAHCENLTKIYGVADTRVVALDGVSVEFPSGQFTAVMGPSGSGKSTLMHCLAGLDSPTTGAVYIQGQAIGSLNDNQKTLMRREKIGFIFQAFNLVPTLTAAENILLPLRIAGKKADPAWRQRVEKVVGLEGRLAHKPSELSGGQQQRVAIARALITKPAIIFADEPTGNLDSNSSADVLGLLRQVVNELGATVVMVTHDPGATAYADQAIFLADGKIVRTLERPSRAAVLHIMGELSAPASHPHSGQLQA